MRHSLMIVMIMLAGWLYGTACFEVVESTADHMILSFETPEWSLPRNAGETERYFIGDFEEFLSEPGAPRLPVFSGVVGIPPEGDFTVTILRDQVRNYSGIDVPPVTDVDPDGRTGSSKDSRSAEVYGRDRVYPQQWVEKGDPGYAGDRYLAAFKLNAFRYNPVRKTLSVMEQATIRIDFQGRTAPAENWQRHQNAIDGMDLCLNESEARRWRKTPLPLPEHSTHSSRSGQIERIQIVVDDPGIYKVTYEQLMEQIFSNPELPVDYEFSWTPDTVDPRFLQLEGENGIAPLHFPGEADGSFDPGDSFEFYGDRHYGDHGYMDDTTGENVYSLCLVENLGARMAVENGGLEITDPSRYTVPVSFEQTIHFEEQLRSHNLGYYKQEPKYREDIWFWYNIEAPHMEIIPFQLQHPHMTNIRYYTARVMLMGSTHYDDSTEFPPDLPDHHAEIRLNESMIGSAWWFHQDEQLIENTDIIPNSFLINGENTLYVSLPGDTGAPFEQVLLDWVDLTYWRLYRTDTDEIVFTKPSIRPLGLFQFEVSGFSSSDVSIYKIGSSIMENYSTEAFTEEGNPPFKIIFQDEVISDDVQYIAVTESEKKNPVRLKPDLPSDLQNPTNTADYLILTDERFVNSEGLLHLVETWDLYGSGYVGFPLETRVVSVQDIYDEYNYGIPSPDAIKDFLRYAYHYWNMGDPGRKIQHVLLLGEGIYDQRDNSPNREYNIIPIHNIWTFKNGATPSDHWYACIIGDDEIADFSIGRLNVWEEEGILSYAEKVRDYIENPHFEDFWHSRIIMAAGGKVSDGEDLFAQQSETIREKTIPEEYDVVRVFAYTEDAPEEFHGNSNVLRDEIDEGAILLQFMGHGGGRIWADYNLMDFNSINRLENEVYPFVVSMSCFGSSFETIGPGSISEYFTMVENKGAIGHIGFSGLGYKYEDETFSTFLLDALFNKGVRSLGNATLYAKTRIRLTNFSNPGKALSTGCVLTGDPLIHLILPEGGVDVGISPRVASPGDTIHVHVSFPPDITLARMQVYDDRDVLMNLPITYPLSQGEFTQEYIVPQTGQADFVHTIRVFGIGPDGTYFGTGTYSSEEVWMSEVVLDPSEPTWNDSLHIQGRFNMLNGIQSIVCKTQVFGAPQQTIPMVKIEGNLYRTEEKIPPFRTNQLVDYHFEITDMQDEVYVTEMLHYTVRGPFLRTLSADLLVQDNQPVIQLHYINYGTAEAPAFNGRCYRVLGADNRPVLLGERMSDPLGVLKTGSMIFPLGDSRGYCTIRMTINPDEIFSEDTYWDNIFEVEQELNYYQSPFLDESPVSLDGNVVLEMDSGCLPDGTYLSLTAKDNLIPVHQQDIAMIPLASGSENRAYDIAVLDESALADTLGTFANQKSALLRFHVSQTDSLIQEAAATDRMAVYRWNETYRKWLYCGGEYNPDDFSFAHRIDRTGTYALLWNQDMVAPSIDANVESQEFTYGGYIASDGIISITLSDANGIDVIDHPPQFFLEGEPVPSHSITLSSSRGNLISVPVKYQLDLRQGNYTLYLECSDVNGNYSERTIHFIVNTTFDVVNLANYPNPVRTQTIEPVNEGRTRFTYTLTDQADHVKIQVYTVLGRLVRTFDHLPTSVGYHEYPRTTLGWDCKDKDGIDLANGVYFYRITASKGDRRVQKTQKMAILK